MELEKENRSEKLYLGVFHQVPLRLGAEGMAAVLGVALHLDIGISAIELV